jgi:mono/diheme cytochrome c family protein
MIAGKAAAAVAQPGALVGSRSGALARLLLVIALAAWQLAAPAVVHAQTDAAKLFGQHCVKCHGADGAGKPARVIEPAIPDFTAASWQAKRTDAQLLASILDGKGQTMPAFRIKAKISEEQARGLVAHVRAFAPSKKKSDLQQPNEPGADSFAGRFRCLEQECAALRQQFRQLSQASDGKLSTNSAAPAAAGKPAESQSAPDLDQPASADPSPPPQTARVFRRLFGSSRRRDCTIFPFAFQKGASWTIPCPNCGRLFRSVSAPARRVRPSWPSRRWRIAA